MTIVASDLLLEIDRILQSETFRNAEALRRLLKYLGEKSAAGQANYLKEYTVGVDGLGRAETYDPKQDATVRIQMGRLRHKLADYHRLEGKDAPFIVDIPKGTFRVTCEPRAPESVPPAVTPGALPITVAPKRVTDRSKIWLSLALVAAILWAGYLTLHSQAQPRSADQWNSSLEELWRPFLTSQRPIVVSIADPLFLEFKGFGYFRSTALNNFETAKSAPSVVAIGKALNNPPVERASRYVMLGQVTGSFLLGKTLAPRVGHISVGRSSDLSWQQLADNNVVFLGSEQILGSYLQGTPLEPELRFEGRSIRVKHPQPGQPALLPLTAGDPAEEDGEIYALVNRMPGPGGAGDVAMFLSYATAGQIGAVEEFTDPVKAQLLVTKLKGNSGAIPRYFQVLLKVKFKSSVPVDTTYILHRALTTTAVAAGAGQP